MQALDTPWPQYWFDRLGSTSDEAQRRISDGEGGPCWIATDLQTAGRGRRGRRWVGALGNLFATAIYPHQGSIQDAAQSCFVAGLAVCDVLDACSGGVANPKLKWPNDVRLDGAKIAGILIESHVQADRGVFLTIGIGINLAVAPDAAYATTSLNDLCGSVPTARAALTTLDASLRQRLTHWHRSGFQPIREAWLERAEGLGERLVQQNAQSTLEGVFTGLTLKGELILRADDGRDQVITAGDVQLVREAT